MSIWDWRKTTFVKLTADELALLRSLLGKQILPKKDDSLISRLQAASDRLTSKTYPTVFDRLEVTDLTGRDNCPLAELDEFVFSWKRMNEEGAADETLFSKLIPNERGLSGGHNHRGIYHPKSVCEGDGICIHCGCTLRWD